jgi:hypothetical protein
MQLIGKGLGSIYLLIYLTLSVGCQKPSLSELPVDTSDLASQAPPQEEPIVSEEPTQKMDLFKDISLPQATLVDAKTATKNELRQSRASQSLSQQDQCVPSLKGKSSFADLITYFTYSHFEPMTARLDYIKDAYALPISISQYQAVGLHSHPLCPVSESTLTANLSGRNVPKASTISKINSFVNKANNLRQQMIQGESSAGWELTKLWTRFFMCLSVVESLGNPDSQSSASVARKVAPAGYVRPKGVAFYEDPLQPPVSRLNIGLYQFTPNSKGNVLACLKQWNHLYPQCSVSESASESEMIKLLGSGYQTFNAFCGVNKVQQMFSVQVNTREASKTDPANQIRQGVLKSASNRCVSLNFAAGKSYNHFGPLQNSTGTNLEKLLSCVGI